MILGEYESVCEAPLLSVSVKSYGQNKTIYILYVSLYGASTKHVVKMASLVVTCMPSSNLERTKHQRSGQVYRILLLRKACYSSQVSRVCVASV